jgi:Aspartyl/Asparaginyl beta-hydroxylase
MSNLSQPQDENLIDEWWEAVGEWYNSGDYREAMELFLQAVNGYCFDAEDAVALPPSHIDAYSIDHLEMQWNKMIQHETNKSDDASTTRDFDLALARLLVFVAGCCLDAADTEAARKCLYRSLWLSCRHGSSGVATDALQEYMASYQESNDVAQHNSWLVAARVVELALQSNSISKWSNLYQRPAYMYAPGQMNQKAVYPASEHPSWCRVLEENAAIIQAEFEQLLRTKNNSSSSSSPGTPTHWPVVGAGDHRGGAGEHDGTVVTSGDWREVVLVGAGARPDLAPATARLIREYCADAVSLADAGAGEVIFSVLAAGTHVEPHTASHNLRLTAHLGLRIPQSGKPCYLRVADQECHWEAGKMLVFDDSFEHEVVNGTDEIRGILLLRFWHPSIPANERTQALQQVVAAQQDDRLRRCNPPLPPGYDDNDVATARGMERTVCTKCWRTGYESIRLLVLQRTFVCACGTPIGS